ncbi:ankyrin repeat domain-containing protein [Hydrogenophaga sp. BPS33]|uniref:ankyrin repeat domain-containing protein n=1 Tax=Hydrogenophaga sp. BPS33 TaxID=2651974 RepID=UPI0013202E34|nr:ankyrin repeat domain-containing protein [Hydrogenophaga sp. BPS33]QHE84382.1 hypothetical protein F9K07_05500 [Hydrogenophaga sp. BPS33]
MKVAPTSRSRSNSDTEFSTVQQQQDLLRKLGIDPAGAKAQTLIAKHGHTLYLALQGSQAPLTVRDDGNGVTNVAKAPKARDRAVGHALPNGFGELALALADAAPVQALPLLSLALDCPAPPVTWTAVELAFTKAQDASQHPPTATTATTFTTTTTTTTTQTATHAPTTRTTPGSTTTTLTATTTAIPPPLPAPQPGTTLSVQAQKVQQANKKGPEKWVEAIHADDPEKVLALLMLSPLLNETIKDGATPLQLAARQEKLKVLDCLLEHPDIDPARARDKGWTALHEAARFGRAGAMARLLKVRGIPLNAPLASGATPFLLALEYGHWNVAQLLLEKEREVRQPQHRSCVNRAMHNGVAPLHAACHYGNVEVVQWLLAQAEIRQGIAGPRHIVAVLNLVTTTGVTPLLQAAASGKTEVVDELLKQPGVHPNPANHAGDMPLHAALKGKHALTVLALLQHKGVDIQRANAAGATPFLLAIQYQQTSAAVSLLDKGAHIGLCTNDGFAALHLACQNGDLELVRWLLQQPGIWKLKGQPGSRAAVLNQRTRKGDTPLTLATRSGNARLVAFLLKQQDIRPNEADDEGCTPLIEAAKHQRIDLIELLLVHPDIDVNSASDSGDTAFSLAIKNNHLEMAKRLHQSKANINRPTPGEFAPLHQACRNHHLEIVQWLLEQPDLWRHGGKTLARKQVLNQPSDDSSRPLHYAIGHGPQAQALVKFLLEQTDIDVNTANAEGTPLHAAARMGLTEIVGMLLAHKGIQVDAMPFDNGTAFHSAIWHGQLGVAQQLLNKGAYPQAIRMDGATPLHLASDVGKLVTVKWLLRKLLRPQTDGKRLDPRRVLNARMTDGNTPLHAAAAKGHAKVVRVLLKQTHIEPNPVNQAGHTPLHEAVIHRHEEAIDALLEHPGVGVDQPDASGHTALYWAIAPDTEEMVDALLNHGADIHQTFEAGFTALHIAGERGATGIIRALLKRPEILLLKGQPRDRAAVLNQTTDSGKTPLQLAAQEGHVQTVRFLLAQEGIDPNKADVQSIAPLHAACLRARHETIAVLLTHPKTDRLQPGPYGNTALHLVATQGKKALPSIHALQAGMPRNDFLAWADERNAWDTKAGSRAAQFHAGDDVIQALPMAPVTMPSALPQTSYKRGWVVVGGAQPQWNNQELVAIGKKGEIPLQTYGDGKLDLTWKGLQALAIQAGDLVLCQFRVHWDSVLMEEMVDLGRGEKVPKAEVLRLFFERGVMKLLFLDAQDDLGNTIDVATVWRSRLQNDPAIPRPTAANGGYTGLDYTLMTGSAYLMGKNQVAAQQWLKDGVAEKTGFGKRNALLMGTQMRVDTLAWDAGRQEVVIHTRKIPDLEEFSGPLDYQRTGRIALLFLHTAHGATEPVHELLTEHGVNPNAPDELGRSALHLACLCGKTDIAALLLEHRAKVDAEDPSTGETALHLASRNGHLAIVKVLIDAGADRQHRCKKALSAIDLAKAHGHHAIAHLLEPGTERTS